MNANSIFDSLFKLRGELTSKSDKLSDIILGFTQGDGTWPSILDGIQETFVFGDGTYSTMQTVDVDEIIVKKFKADGTLDWMTQVTDHATSGFQTFEQFIDSTNGAKYLTDLGEEYGMNSYFTKMADALTTNTRLAVDKALELVDTTPGINYIDKCTLKEYLIKIPDGNITQLNFLQIVNSLCSSLKQGYEDDTLTYKEGTVFKITSWASTILSGVMSVISTVVSAALFAVNKMLGFIVNTILSIVHTIKSNLDEVITSPSLDTDDCYNNYFNIPLGGGSTYSAPTGVLPYKNDVVNFVPGYATDYYLWRSESGLWSYNAFLKGVDPYKVAAWAYNSLNITDIEGSNFNASFTTSFLSDIRNFRAAGDVPEELTGGLEVDKIWAYNSDHSWMNTMWAASLATNVLLDSTMFSFDWEECSGSFTAGRIDMGEGSYYTSVTSVAMNIFANLAYVYSITNGEADFLEFVTLFWDNTEMATVYGNLHQAIIDTPLRTSYDVSEGWFNVNGLTFWRDKFPFNEKMYSIPEVDEFIMERECYEVSSYPLDATFKVPDIDPSAWRRAILIGASLAVMTAAIALTTVKVINKLRTTNSIKRQAKLRQSYDNMIAAQNEHGVNSTEAIQATTDYYSQTKRYGLLAGIFGWDQWDVANGWSTGEKSTGVDNSVNTKQSLGLLSSGDKSNNSIAGLTPLLIAALKSIGVDTSTLDI